MTFPKDGMRLHSHKLTTIQTVTAITAPIAVAIGTATSPANVIHDAISFLAQSVFRTPQKLGQSQQFEDYRRNHGDPDCSDCAKHPFYYWFL